MLSEIWVKINKFPFPFRWCCPAEKKLFFSFHFPFSWCCRLDPTPFNSLFGKKLFNFNFTFGWYCQKYGLILSVGIVFFSFRWCCQEEGKTLYSLLKHYFPSSWCYLEEGNHYSVPISFQLVLFVRGELII